MTFIDDTRSNTTARNASRFLPFHPLDSSTVSLGVDFQHTLNSIEPFYIDSSYPISLSVDTRY